MSCSGAVSSPPRPQRLHRRAQLPAATPPLPRGSAPLGKSVGLLAALLFAAPASAAPSPTPADTPADSTDARARAAALVERGHAAYDRADYPAALAAFEEAHALRPSPKLHYNLGVCHQRLMESAAARGDAAAESAHAVAAIDAFNRYLVERPTADDRTEVEALIRALGGAPATASRLKPVPTPPTRAPDDAPAVADSAPKTPSPPDPPPATAPADPAVPAPWRGHLGPRLGLWLQPQLSRDPGTTGAALAVFGVAAAAHLGPRRRLRLGGALDLAASARQAGKLALTAQVLAATAGLALPAAHGRLEFPLELALGLAREALQADGQAAVTCATGPTLVSQRLGGWVGGRAGAVVLVGARRNHGLGLHLGAAFVGFGRGSRAPGCDASPFEDLRVPRLGGVVQAELAYTLRF